MKFFTILFLICFCISPFAHATQVAQKNDSAKKDEKISVLFKQPELKRDIQKTRKIFDSETILIEEKPLGDSALSFSLRLPPSWRKIDESLMDGKKLNNKEQGAKDVLNTVVEYASPPILDQRMFFKLRVASLPFAISAKNWFLNFMVNNNYTLQGFEEVSANRLAAQFIYVDAGVQYISRAVIERTGGRIVVAEYIIPVSLWKEQRDNAIWSMVTFKLTSPSTESAEKLLNHSFVDIAKFSYPESWLLHSDPITTIERMSAMIVNVKGGHKGRMIENIRDVYKIALDGRIDITSVTKKNEKTLSEEIKKIRDEYAKLGFEIGDYMGEIKIDKLHPSILQSRTDVYKINSQTLNIVDYELWLSVVETSGRYYIVQTLSIGRENDFYPWARNFETLKILLRSLQPAKRA